MIGAAAAYMSGLFFALFFTDAKGVLMYLSAAVIVYVYGRRRGFRLADYAVITVSFAAAAALSLSYTALSYERINGYAGKTGSFTGEVTGITRYEEGNTAYTLKGRIDGETPAKIMIYSGDLHARVGDEMSIAECSFYKPENGYLYASERIYRSRHIYVKASGLKGLKVTRTNRRIVKRALDSYRDKTVAKFKSELGSECGGFLAGMVFGDKSDFDENTRTVLYRTGIGHVLAVSGLHVSILAGLIWTLLSRLRVNRFISFGVINVMLLLLTATANYPVSALRAAIMLDIMYSAKLFRRQNDSLNSLSVAVLLIAISDPYCVCSAGFLLSVSGTFGIAVFAPYMTKNMKREMFRQRLAADLITGICTTLSVFPVTLWFFDETSLAAPFANLLLLPMCTASMATGFIYVLTFGVLPILPLAGGVIRTVIFISERISALGVFHISDTAGYLRGLLLIALTVIVFAHLFRRSRRLTAVLTAAGIAMGAACTSTYGMLRRRQFTVAVLGSGANAAVVIMHDGHTDIADLSGSRRSAEYVRKYLTVNNASSADTVILTRNAQTVCPIYAEELRLFSLKKWVVPEDGICTGAETVGDRFRISDNGCIIGYDSGRLDIACGGAEISFAPASSGADDGSITVFYGRHKDKTLPEGKKTIDLQTGGNDLEFTPAGDGFRIRRL